MIIMIYHNNNPMKTGRGKAWSAYRYVSKMRQVTRPPYNLIKAVVGYVEQRREQIRVSLRQFALATVFLLVIVMHERLHRHEVLKKLWCLRGEVGGDRLEPGGLLNVHHRPAVVHRQYRDDVRARWRHLSRTGGGGGLTDHGWLTVGGDHFHGQVGFSALLFHVPSVRRAAVV